MLWLEELHFVSEYLAALEVLLPVGVRDVDHRISFELLEYVLHTAAFCLVLSWAPDLGCFGARWALYLPEHFDYHGDIRSDQKAEWQLDEQVGLLVLLVEFA